MIDYLTVYGQHYYKGTKIHDPMCELFPTEVRKHTSYIVVHNNFDARYRVTCMWAHQQGQWIEAISFAFYKTTCLTKSTSSSSGAGGCSSSSSLFLDSSTDWPEFYVLHFQGKILDNQDFISLILFLYFRNVFMTS